jgi:hypothetical protein
MPNLFSTVFFAVVLIVCRADMAAAQAPAPAAAPLKLLSVKYFSDQIINKAEKTPDGFKIEFGARAGTVKSPGSELASADFPEKQLVQYSRAQFAPGSAGKPVNVVVIAEKTSRGIEKKVLALSGKIADDGSLPIEVSLPGPWPVGTYRMEFYAGQTLFAKAGYNVLAEKQRASPVKLTQVKIFAQENNKAVERVSPKPGDRYLDFIGLTTGAKTAGATVKFTLTFVGAGDGKTSQQVMTLTVDGWPLENTPLGFNAELPRDWPPGKYRVDFVLDGKPLGESIFEIKA